MSTVASTTRCQVVNLVTIQKEQFLEFGGKLLPCEPLDCDRITFFLSQSVDDDQFDEELPKWTALSAHIPPDGNPFAALRFLGCQGAAAIVDRRQQMTNLQTIGCRCVLSMRHLKKVGPGHEEWWSLAKGALDTLRHFANTLSAMGDTEEESGDDQVSASKFWACLRDSEPWGNMDDDSKAVGSTKTSYENVYKACVRSFEGMCVEDLQEQQVKLESCLPNKHEEYINSPDDEACVKKIHDHVFGNPHHKKINSVKDAVKVRTDLLENLELGGRAPNPDVVQALKQAKELWEKSHTYLGTVSVLNCILNRPREPGITRHDLERHVSKVKSALQTKKMNVSTALLGKLDMVTLGF